MGTIFDFVPEKGKRTSWKTEAQRLDEELSAVRAELAGAHRAAQDAIRDRKRLTALVDAKTRQEREYKVKIAELEARLAASSAPRCGRPRQYGADDAERARGLLAGGLSYRGTARALGCSLATVQRLIKM